METETIRFEEVYGPIRDALFDTHLAADAEARILFSKDYAAHGHFVAIFETVRPGLYLRASGRIPGRRFSGIEAGRCELMLATADVGGRRAPRPFATHGFENWTPVRTVSLDGTGEVSTASLRTRSTDEVFLSSLLLEVAVAILPVFEGLYARAGEDA